MTVRNEILISVIVPLYNKAPWVDRCIQSIINQTYENIEILVVNDGSTDNSRELVDTIDDPRIKIYDKPNNGVSSARNLGIKEAKGEYIALLDADDEWMAKHLEVLLEGFRQFDNAILVCDNLVEIIDGKTADIQHRRLPVNLSEGNDNNIHYMIIEDYLQTLKDNYFILSGSSVLIKSAVIKEYQLKFSNALTHGEDINFWLHLNHFGRFVFCDYLGLYYHRVDENSAMSKTIQEVQLVPSFFYELEIESYNKKEIETINKFLIREYYKKAYQNRSLPLKSDELSTHIGGGIKIAKWNILLYLVIRYSPQVLFSLYKKINVIFRRVDV